MTPPRHLKLTLILVALVLALTIAGKARADVTAEPAPPATVTGAPDVSGPQLTDASAPATDTSTTDTSTPATDPAPPDQVPGAPPSGDQPTAASDPTSAEPTMPGDPTTPGPTTSDASTPDPTTSTNQVIVQVQVSGCTANCQGTSQTQAAQQQSVTVQGAPSATTSSQATDQGTAAPHPQSSAQVTQVQIGCVHDCSGTSLDTTAPPISPGTLAQLLGALSLQASSGQLPDAPDAQSGVEQTSLQSQQGDGSDGDQLQSASQQSITIQGAVSQAVIETVQAVNQTTQTIVQVQIGCLFHCTDTHETQQASQTSTAVQVVAQGVSAATAPATTVVSIVNQLIWQLQIGCLAWCSDTTQEQSAQQGAEIVVTTDPPSSDDPSPADPGPTPGPGDPAPTQVPPPVTPSPAPVVTPQPPPVVTPQLPPVVTPQSPPRITSAAPPVAVRTKPSSGRISPQTPRTRVAGRRPASRGLVGVPPAPGGAIGTRIVPVARHRTAPIRSHDGARISRQISTGSWRMQRSGAKPATLSLLPAGQGRGPNTGTSAILAIVVALGLGLLLLTTIRVRTR
ncbi:MAG: hypothetical protein ACXVW5_27195 [Solirubrobacteraceae bacterium]